MESLAKQQRIAICLWNNLEYELIEYNHSRSWTWMTVSSRPFLSPSDVEARNRWRQSRRWLRQLESSAPERSARRACSQQHRPLRTLEWKHGREVPVSRHTRFQSLTRIDLDSISREVGTALSSPACPCEVVPFEFGSQILRQVLKGLHADSTSRHRLGGCSTAPWLSRLSRHPLLRPRAASSRRIDPCRECWLIVVSLGLSTPRSIFGVSRRNILWREPHTWYLGSRLLFIWPRKKGRILTHHLFRFVLTNLDVIWYFHERIFFHIQHCSFSWRSHALDEQCLLKMPLFPHRSDIE